MGYYSAGPHKGDEVVNRLVQRRPDWKFLVVGRNYTTDFKDRPSHLECRGDLPDMTEFYGRAGVLLVPSLVEEAFSRVVLEAAINGIPIVANRVGGIPEALGEGGLLIDVDLSRLRETGYLDALAGEYETKVDRLFRDADYYALYRRKSLERARLYLKNQALVSQRNTAELFDRNRSQRTR